MESKIRKYHSIWYGDNLMSKLKNILRYWLPLAAVTTLLCGLIYLAVQQSLRWGANDPQIQMAEDAAAALAAGGHAEVHAARRPGGNIHQPGPVHGHLQRYRASRWFPPASCMEQLPSCHRVFSTIPVRTMKTGYPGNPRPGSGSRRWWSLMAARSRGSSWRDVRCAKWRNA